MQTNRLKISMALIGALLSTTLLIGSTIKGVPFTSKQIQIGTMLEWGTNAEPDMEFFIIEKSQDGLSFEEITQIKSTGDITEGSNYSYIDLFPKTTKSFYRLKMVYTDGSFKYDGTIEVATVEKTNFVISNISTVNPTNLWHINLEVFSEGALAYEWQTTEGVEISSGIKRMKEGINTITCDFMDWPDAVYTLNMNLKGDQKKATIQKLGNSAIQVDID